MTQIQRLTSVEPPVEERWATRVWLQPIAAPSLLGIMALSVSLMMSGTIDAKWWGTRADLTGIGVFGFTFGGIAQLWVAMWCYRARDAAGTLTHGTWGAYWLAFLPLHLLHPAGMAFSFGLWMIGLASVTAIAAVAREVSHPLIAVMRAVMTAAAACEAVGYVGGGGFASGWVTAGGWLFAIAAAIGWLAGMYLLFHTQRQVRPVQLAWREPGVERGP